MDELISKKDLLKETGISYGQLYRWKRERLIPESWFQKRSVSTGQETFFPRERTLHRVRTILELKDTKSLEELAAMFSPDPSKRPMAPNQLLSVPALSAGVARFIRLRGEEPLPFGDLVFAAALTKLEEENRVPSHALDELVESAEQWRSSANEDMKLLTLCKCGEQYLSMLLPRDVTVVPAARAEIVAQIPLEDMRRLLFDALADLGDASDAL